MIFYMQLNESDPGAGCTSGFVGAVPGQTLILGCPFLRQWYTTYSYDPGQDSAEVGIARSTHSMTDLGGG